MTKSDTHSVPRNLHNYYDRVYRIRKMVRSPKTWALAHMAIRRFGEAIGVGIDDATIDDLTDEQLSLFISIRLDSGVAEHTVDKERDKLMAMANYAARKRHIKEFPDAPQIRPASRLPQCWSEASVRKLLKACRETTGRIGGARACDWWLAFHYVALTTGERTSAILDLRWEWLDGDVLRVPAEARKGKKKPMLYKLPKPTMDAVMKLWGCTHGRIFETYRSRFSFWLWYKKLLVRAELPHGRKWKPQALRRTFASWLEASGGDATKALSHTDRRTTVDSYLDAGVVDDGKSTPGDAVAGMLGL